MWSDALMGHAKQRARDDSWYANATAKERWYICKGCGELHERKYKYEKDREHCSGACARKTLYEKRRRK
jgi:hypothetical protein